VEGSAGRRIAIECDGDQYHGPDVWMEDMQRQRVLERAGWTFWRCWGSSWIRDADECFRDLLQKFADLCIEPIGSSDIDLSDVVNYREVFGIEPESEDDGEDDVLVENEVLEEPDNHSQEEESTVAANSSQSVPRKADDITDSEIMRTIQEVLQACPNQTCKVDVLPTKLLKTFGIRTRSGPRVEFAKRVHRVAKKLIKNGVIEKYTATNERYKLLRMILL
jgi:phosphoribosylformylglycinamidine (FGAM) synthase PurS component